MSNLITLMIAFLVMLNPFALFLYLNPIMEELDNRSFLKVLFKATIMSFFTLLVFLLAGSFLFSKVLQISFESFRIFGGIIIFSFAYLFIVKGHKSLINMKENLNDLASEIALPFMVGAGTISIAIVMSHQLPETEGIFALISVMAINYIIITVLKMIKDGLSRKKLKVAFDKNMEVLLRLNGFFVGAIGINMIVTGVLNTFL